MVEESKEQETRKNQKLSGSSVVLPAISDPNSTMPRSMQAGGSCWSVALTLTLWLVSMGSCCVKLIPLANLPIRELVILHFSGLGEFKYRAVISPQLFLTFLFQKQQSRSFENYYRTSSYSKVFE